MKKRLTPLAEMLGIAGILEKYPYEVSGGQKQRAAVARALITKPDLILADEPTGALDSRSTDSLLAVFEEINRKGQTILMVTHSIKAASHAGRVLFIKDGTVFHQIYRGELQREAMYQKISDTLTLLTTGGNSHEKGLLSENGLGKYPQKQEYLSSVSSGGLCHDGTFLHSGFSL